MDKLLDVAELCISSLRTLRHGVVRQSTLRPHVGVGLELMVRDEVFIILARGVAWGWFVDRFWFSNSAELVNVSLISISLLCFRWRDVFKPIRSI